MSDLDSISSSESVIEEAGETLHVNVVPGINAALPGKATGFVLDLPDFVHFDDIDGESMQAYVHEEYVVDDLLEFTQRSGTNATTAGFGLIRARPDGSSNARIVQWSDGSYTLQVGKYHMVLNNVQAHAFGEVPDAREGVFVAENESTLRNIFPVDGTATISDAGSGLAERVALRVKAQTRTDVEEISDDEERDPFWTREHHVPRVERTPAIRKKFNSEPIGLNDDSDFIDFD